MVVQHTIEIASSSIDAEGFAKFTSASIGGFEINDTEISSSGLIMSSSGQIDRCIMYCLVVELLRAV